MGNFWKKIRQLLFQNLVTLIIIYLSTNYIFRLSPSAIIFPHLGV